MTGMDRLRIQPQALLLIILALLLLPWLGTTWFNSKGEPREAIVAVSILQSGNWILPVNYGGDIPFKPPFLAWLIAIFAKIFNGGNVNEYISRLPSALACMAMVWAGYRWSARLRGERFAMVMSLVTVTSVEVLRAAVVCRLDMLLTAAMLIAMYQLFRLQSRAVGGRPWRYALVIAMMSAATLTKGPVGALLPCLVLGVYYLLRGEKFLPTLLKLSALCAASFVLPMLWYLGALAQGGDNFAELMYEENLGRLTGTMSYGSHVHPFWYNFVTLLSGMAPWTLLGLLALTVARRFSYRPFKPAGLFCACSFVLVLLFYCIPESKRSVYLLPLYPAMAYAVTCMIFSLEKSRVLKAYVWILAVVSALLPVAVLLLRGGVISAGRLRLWPAEWWMWPLLFLPLAAALLWMADRRHAVRYAVGLPLAIAVSTLAAYQPMALRPNSDRQFLPQLVDAPEVRSYDNPSDVRYFTLNFYLADRIRPISGSAALDSLPKGSVVIYTFEADSAAFSKSYTFRHLSDRASDYRRELRIAVKSK